MQTDIGIKGREKVEEITTLMLLEIEACTELIKSGKVYEGVQYMKDAVAILNTAVDKAEKFFPKLTQAKLFEEA